MRMQKFLKITKRHKKALVAFAKKNGHRFNVEENGRFFNVTVYCSSEAMEDVRF